MLSRELVEKVRTELKNGTAKEELWRRLREEGWSEGDINEAFLFAGEGDGVQHEEKELPPREEYKELEEEQILPPGDVHEKEKHGKDGAE